MRDSTIRLLIQGVLAVVALIGLIIVGAFAPDAEVMKVLELILIAAVAYFLGYQGGKPNGIVSKNGG
jgi:hypothetical protein